MVQIHSAPDVMQTLGLDLASGHRKRRRRWLLLTLLLLALAAAAILVPNAALRFAPPVQPEGKSSHGGLLSALLPRPPHSRSQPREAATADQTQSRVWVLRDGQAVSIPVTVGATDGVMTEVIDGPIEPGMALLVDTVSGGR